MNSRMYWIVHEYDSTFKPISESEFLWIPEYKGETHHYSNGEGWTLNVIVETIGQEGVSFSASLKQEVSINTIRYYAMELLLRTTAKPDEIYSLFPGSVYAHNQYGESLQLTYPPRLSRFDDCGPDGPIYTGDILRFSEDAGYCLIQQTYDLTQPAAGIFSDNERNGIWLQSDIGSLTHPNGFKLRSNSGKLEFSISYPAVRKRRYRQTGRWEVSPDIPIALSPGECFEARGAVHWINADSRNDWIKKVVRMNPMDSWDADAPVSVLPISHSVKLIEQKVNDHNWRESLSYYDDNQDRLQVGWVSGTCLIYCIILSGNELSRQRALRELRFILTQGESPIGLHYGIFEDGEWKGKFPYTGIDFAGCHIRRVADMYVYLLRILDVEWIEGEIRDLCENVLVKGIEEFHRIGKTYGHFGHSIDLGTGKMLWGGSAAGISCISLLARASKKFNRHEWLETAIITEPYYRNMLKKGYTTGGPGDILMAADSESNFAMVEAYWELYEASENCEYLVYCKQAADLFSTWVFTVNYELPAESTHGKAGIQSKGLVMANVQNKHGAPGICTSSGSALLSLYEATGDRFYMELLVNIKRSIPQTLNRELGYIEGALLGEIPENVNIADSMKERGEVYLGAVWAEITTWLSHVETPSVYISSQREIFVLDHCHAVWTEEGLKITNSTKYHGDFVIIYGNKRVNVELSAFDSKTIFLN